MEVELYSNSEDTVEADVRNDNFGGEGERCGICMDIVVDRGVLDCCQHWFCFTCIDNWATITNLCPLCQNEFQLITCVPVYDTISSGTTDEDLDLRDDDWRVEGSNNTLSFPSYYIDENSVTCLDGDGCKMRGGSMTYEENSTLDTSIACDSCDIWYHAFCVGFDPDGSDVDSWLCPRCLVNEADLKETNSISNQLITETTDSHCLVDTFSGKVFVSVADAGETAVVVSTVCDEHVEEQILDAPPSEDFKNDHESMLGLNSCSFQLGLSLDRRNKDSHIHTEPTVSSAKLSGVTVKSEPIEDDSGISLGLGLSLSASNPEEDKKPDIVLRDDTGLFDTSNKIPPDESLGDVKADPAPKCGEKRKRTDYSFLTNDDDNCDKVKPKSGSSAKKVKNQRGIPKNSSIDKAQNSPSDDLQKTNNKTGSSGGETRECVFVKEPSPIDIMSIVREPEPKTASRDTRQKEADKCSKAQKNTAKLRVKKIMRRPSDDKESADLVQKLRKEIKEAMRKKPSDDVEKSIDPNLLSAFRAAVVGSASEPVKKATVKANIIVSQKGKPREKLTKKIYATSNGRRRRAWDRDCQVEFWKHRCTMASKTEKIETLRSVLGLLKKDPETEKVKGDSEEEAKTPLLSRLYLADASLFPRKDDIKPLSVLKAKQNGDLCSEDRDNKTCPDTGNVKTTDSNEVPSQSNTSTTPTTDDKNKKLQAGKQFDKMSGKSEDVKVDKRKWALEVLARKTASSSTSGNHQKQDNTLLKGNYPLLAELPADMWPKPAPARHNKIPASVRQTQLYRLAEHFLKALNLPSIRRTGATELAVADAINIEKQVADRSNSKAVYLNLCSQEVRNHPNSSNPCMPLESTPPSPPPLPPSPPTLPSTGGGESSAQSLDSEAEAALRAAGLLSDSPPSSPPHNIEDKESPVVEVKEEGMENVLEIDSHPELDIYGDFEYDLDEDIIAASAPKVSEAQAEEGESKVKVVFSTLTSSKTDSASDCKEKDLPKTGSIPPMCTSSVVSQDTAQRDSTAIAGEDDSGSKPTGISLEGEGEELSLAECEALYGPEKEPLVKQFPVVVSADNVGPQSTTDLNPDGNISVPDSDRMAVGERHPSSSQPVEKEKKEDKKGDPKLDKKSERTDSVLKKVEAYIKEHIRPLCKSGVITVEQYRWAVGKTAEKVMKYHSKAKNANFLIKEGEKVKKLAEQYVDAAKHKETK